MYFTAMEISGHRKEGYTNEGQALQEEAEQVLLSLCQVILALCSLLGSHKMSFGGKKMFLSLLLLKEGYLSGCIHQERASHIHFSLTQHAYLT